MDAIVLDLREEGRRDERRELGKESQFSLSSHLPARTLVLALSIAAVFTLGIYANDFNAASSSTRENVGVRESSTNSSTVVKTKNGLIQGIRTNGTVGFLGIPYAKPPIGDGRYRSPLPAEPWNGTLQATAFAPGCPQKCKLPPIMCPTKQSEDCLYLNVFVPDAEPPEGGWPVYVFIHGGAYENGHAGTLAYVGFGFAEHEIITVTMNYRLGALGFLAYEELGGNYGFQDQIFSLKWVQENIEAFGGNKDWVTLGGESAGAVSVMAHMAAPLSQGLFSKAIMESSPVALPFSKPKNNRFYNHYIEVTGCSDSSASVVACLKNMTAESVVDAMEKTQDTIFPFPNPDIIAMPWTPTIGTVDLPVHPYIAMLNQQSSKVPVLVGGNTEDARVFVFGFANFTMNPIEYYLTLFDLFGKDGPEVLEAYPSVGFGDQRETIERLVTDYLFQCLGRFVAETYSQKMEQPAFLYSFAYPTRMFWGPKWTGWGRVCIDHPCHGGEIMFVFNNIIALHNTTQEERNLAAQMNAYWSNFIKSSDPNGPTELKDLTMGGGVAWPEFGDADHQIWMNFTDDHPSTMSKFKEDKCGLWDKIGYYREPGIFSKRVNALMKLGYGKVEET